MQQKEKVEALFAELKNQIGLRPKLARWMYKRSRAKVSEVKASHLVYITEFSENVIQFLEKQ